MTTKQIAALLGVHPSQVTRYVNGGLFPLASVMHLGRDILIHRSAVCDEQGRVTFRRPPRGNPKLQTARWRVTRLRFGVIPIMAEICERCGGKPISKKDRLCKKCWQALKLEMQEAHFLAPRLPYSGISRTVEQRENTRETKYGTGQG